jgi:hypothetical protein
MCWIQGAPNPFFQSPQTSCLGALQAPMVDAHAVTCHAVTSRCHSHLWCVTRHTGTCVSGCFQLVPEASRSFYYVPHPSACFYGLLWVSTCFPNILEPSIRFQNLLLCSHWLSQFSCATVTPVTTGSSPSDSPNQSSHFEPLRHTKRPHTPMDLCGHTSA